MGYVSDKVESIYKATTFTRRDDVGLLFYYSTVDFPGLTAEKFSFKTEKGHKLNGHFYFYPEYTPDRLIVFDHGMGVGHRAYLREIEKLASAGYLVFSYDHTGCTESEGEHTMGLSGSLADLDACISAMKEKGFAEESISVVGHSWGGFSTLNILHFYPKLKSIVAMSGFISIKDMLGQVIPFIVGYTRPSVYALEQRANPNHYDKNAIDTLSATDRPALIIHSQDDNTVSYKRNFEKLRSATSHKSNLEFLSLKDRCHNPTYTAEAVKYKGAFFKKFTKRTKKKITDMDVHRAFLNTYDWHKITEQDAELWNKIIDFLG